MNQINDEVVKDINSYRVVRPLHSAKQRRDTRINRIHIVLDLYECDDKVLSKAGLLEQKVKKVLGQLQLEPNIQTFYQFQPFGVTAIVCANSIQLTIHTWPEYKSAAMDLYCFNSRKIAMQICDQMKTMFKSTEYEMRVRKR